MQQAVHLRAQCATLMPDCVSVPEKAVWLITQLHSGHNVLAHAGILNFGARRRQTAVAAPVGRGLRAGMASTVPQLALPGDRQGGGGETPKAAARTDLQPASPPAAPVRGGGETPEAAARTDLQPASPPAAPVRGGGETPEAAARTDLQPASPPAAPARGPQVSSHLCFNLASPCLQSQSAALPGTPALQAPPQSALTFYRLRQLSNLSAWANWPNNSLYTCLTCLV